MSDFLMVAPEGWVEIENATDIVDNWPSGSEDAVFSMIASGEFASLEPILEDNGLMPQGQTIVEAQAFKLVDGSLRLWVRFSAL
jgi:hypothetical protein